MVVSALDTQTGKRIAIKKCANLFVDPLDARKIGREIRIMSQLNHPNIIKVRLVCSWGSVPYIAALLLMDDGAQTYHITGHRRAAPAHRRLRRRVHGPSFVPCSALLDHTSIQSTPATSDTTDTRSPLHIQPTPAKSTKRHTHPPRSPTQVGELMDVDLHRAIYYGRPLSPEHVQFFLYQLLCGIKYIHSVGIVHRCCDFLSPTNT